MADFEEGQVAADPTQAAELSAKGYTKCHNQLCDWWISPVAAEEIGTANQKYTCPRCTMSYDLNTAVGIYPREQTTAFKPGGRTIAGVGLADQGQIGEDVIEGLGEVPGYGPLTWWHPGGAAAKSPLDGTTAEWGVEVKAVNADASNLRFIPGRPREKQHKNEAAAKLGLKGVLGVLVLLNYRTSLADIYVMEMPHTPWVTKGNRQVQGVVAYRHHNGTRLVAEVPFKNPLIDPASPTPTVHGQSLGGDYSDDIPF